MSRVSASKAGSDGDIESATSYEEQHVFIPPLLDEDSAQVAYQRKQHSGRRTAAVLAATVLGIVGTLIAPSGRTSGGAVFSSPVSAEASSLGVAVCILGQVSRLEIDSKIRNIAEPLANFTNIDVFLSLETGGLVYNNKATDISGDGCSSTKMSVEEVKEAFAPYFRNGKFEAHTDENVALDRWPLLYKYKHPNETYSDHSARAKHIANVVSQMRHQKDCADLIQQHEEAIGGRYDVVLKVRDNTLALRPVVPEKVLNITAVNFKHCEWWGGVQDKVMLMPRRYLEQTLGDIYPSMLAIMNDPVLDKRLENVSRESENTEQVVKNLIVANGVPWRQRRFDEETHDSHGSDYLPFVDGRCHPGGASRSADRWCVVSHCKDCYPSAPWTFNATCSVDMHTGQITKTINFTERCPHGLGKIATKLLHRGLPLRSMD
jgi:hypothetical protein